MPEKRKHPVAYDTLAVERRGAAAPVLLALEAQPPGILSTRQAEAFSALDALLENHPTLDVEPQAKSACLLTLGVSVLEGNAEG